jgi:hypothetical protein
MARQKRLLALIQPYWRRRLYNSRYSDDEERERESGATPKVYEEKGNPELSTQSLNILGLLGPSSFIRQLLCPALCVFGFGLFFIHCVFVFLNCVSIEPVIWSLSLSFYVEENSWDLFFLDSSRLLVSQLPVDSCNKTIEPVHQVENIFGIENFASYPKLRNWISIWTTSWKIFLGGTSSERSGQRERAKIILKKAGPDPVLLYIPRKGGYRCERHVGCNQSLSTIWRPTTLSFYFTIVIPLNWHFSFLRPFFDHFRFGATNKRKCLIDVRQTPFCFPIFSLSLSLCSSSSLEVRYK